MGSERAYQLLDEMGETDYENYDTQMQKMRDWVTGLTTAEWTETLYNTWLYTFFPLIEVPDENMPAFMQSLAWLDKSLNTVLGSWTELKHDTILYAKQAYAELGGGPPPPPPLPPLSYVEPVPEFYARLAALSAMTRNGLEERGMLDELDGENLQRLEELAGSLQTMAEKELRGEPLTSEEQELIRYIGGDLEHLTMAAADSDSEDPFAPKFMDEDPQAALVADVATNPGAQPEPAGARRSRRARLPDLRGGAGDPGGRRGHAPGDQGRRLLPVRVRMAGIRPPDRRKMAADARKSQPTAPVEVEYQLHEPRR